jgi:hypothetical protein
MRRFFLGLCLSLIFAAKAGFASAQLPEGLRESGVGWIEQGSAKMRWFGLPIYDITLFSARPKFDEALPYALFIRYARTISSEQLADTSIDQMRKLGFSDEASLKRWRAQLKSVFPSVKPGETILGVHEPGLRARFFHQGRNVGVLEDAMLARAFFAIWMDEKTSEPGLRAELLGQK